MPIEIFVDHTGPMTATVKDNALLLEVIAGDDGYDPRIKAPKVQTYSTCSRAASRGMKIAIVKEGFQQPEAEDAVSDKVREAAKHLHRARARGLRRSRFRCICSGPPSGRRSAWKASRKP